MKNVILALFALISVQSFASSPVQPRENSVIELRKIGGMPAPGSLIMRHLWITNRGEVMVDETIRGNDLDHGTDNIQREYLAGYVRASELTEILRAAADVKGGRLQRVHTLPCVDAPSYYYGVAKPSGVNSFFMTESCRDSELVDVAQRPAARILKAYLQAWDQAIP